MYRSINRSMKTLIVAVPLAVATAAVGAGQLANAAPCADAHIRIETTSVAAGVGVGWGEGTLTLSDGRRFRFTVEGLSLANVGVTRVSATGTVHHLTTLTDFDGTYTGVGASATVAAGRGIVRMKNEDGVLIRLKSASQGVGLKLAAEGVRIKLQRLPARGARRPRIREKEIN
jgi:hypothetical protein